MNLKISVLKDALSRAFEEGLCGYSEFKDEVIDSIVSELVSTSETSLDQVVHHIPYSEYCLRADPGYYSFSTSTHHDITITGGGEIL